MIITGFGNFQNRPDNEQIVLEDNSVISDKLRFTDKNGIVLSGGNVELVGTGEIIFKDCSNVRITGLTIKGVEEPDKEGPISIQFNNCKNVQIDNCTFIDGADEQVSIKNGSDWITITNCKFLHTNIKPHAFSILIGKNLEDKPESGLFHVTIHQCIFSKGHGRCPRVRNAILHVLNCLWDRNTKAYLIGPHNTDVFIDSSFKICIFPYLIKRFGDYRCRIKNMEVSRNDYLLLRLHESNEIELPDYEYDVLSKEELLKKLGMTEEEVTKIFKPCE